MSFAINNCILNISTRALAAHKTVINTSGSFDYHPFAVAMSKSIGYIQFIVFTANQASVERVAVFRACRSYQTRSIFMCALLMNPFGININVLCYYCGDVCPAEEVISLVCRICRNGNICSVRQLVGIKNSLSILIHIINGV